MSSPHAGVRKAPKKETGGGMVEPAKEQFSSGLSEGGGPSADISFDSRG